MKNDQLGIIYDDCMKIINALKESSPDPGLDTYIHFVKSFHVTKDKKGLLYTFSELRIFMADLPISLQTKLVTELKYLEVFDGIVQSILKRSLVKSDLEAELLRKRLDSLIENEEDPKLTLEIENLLDEYQGRE